MKAFKRVIITYYMQGLKYKINTINVESGDRIILYTDGVTEAHDKKGNLYGDDRLVEVFFKNINSKEEDTIAAILNDISKFSNGAAQFDGINNQIDICHSCGTFVNVTSL